MLEKILNQKVKIKIAFGSAWASGSTPPEDYVGVIIGYDNNFIQFEDFSLIGIKFIQTIEIISK